MGLTVPSIRNVFKKDRPSSIYSTPAPSTEMNSSQNLQPGDQPADIPHGEKVSSLDIRELNDLIRKRYALDIEIWADRDCMPCDRDLVKANMIRSDAVLEKIKTTVQLWNNCLLWESMSDWEKLQKIKERLDENKMRRWKDNPPWTK